MIRNISNLLTILLIFLLGCNEQENQRKSNTLESKFINDSIEIQNSSIPEIVKKTCFDGNWLWQDIILNHLVIKVVYDDNLNKRDFHFLIREEGDRTNYYIKSVDNKNYILPEYDSLQIDLSNLNNNSYSKGYDQKFSSKFYKLPLLRKEDHLFQKAFTNYEDIKELEKIVNNLKCFEDFKLENYHQKKLLEELFKLTQIITINSSFTDADFISVRRIFKGGEIIPIKTETDFNWFKSSITDTIDRNFVTVHEHHYRWDLLNYEFLKSLESSIEKDYQQNGVFYYYTIPDYKLLKFTVRVDDTDTIHLTKEHLNKEYTWVNDQYVMPELKN